MGRSKRGPSPRDDDSYDSYDYYDDGYRPPSRCATGCSMLATLITALLAMGAAVYLVYLLTAPEQVVHTVFPDWSIIAGVIGCGLAFITAFVGMLATRALSKTGLGCYLLLLCVSIVAVGVVASMVIMDHYNEGTLNAADSGSAVFLDQTDVATIEYAFANPVAWIQFQKDNDCCGYAFEYTALYSEGNPSKIDEYADNMKRQDVAEWYQAELDASEPTIPGHLDAMHSGPKCTAAALNEVYGFIAAGDSEYDAAMDELYRVGATVSSDEFWCREKLQTVSNVPIFYAAMGAGAIAGMLLLCLLTASYLVCCAGSPGYQLIDDEDEFYDENRARLGERFDPDGRRRIQEDDGAESD